MPKCKRCMLGRYFRLQCAASVANVVFIGLIYVKFAVSFHMLSKKGSCTFTKTLQLLGESVPRNFPDHHF